jgi:galactokinase
VTTPQVELPVRLLVQYQSRYPASEPEITLQAPDREMWIMATLNESGRIALDCVDLESRAVFTIHSARGKKTVQHRPLPRWARYAAGVILDMDRNGFTFKGLNAVVGGNEPPGARYEYTLGILFAALALQVYNQPFVNVKLFEIADRARRDYVESK